MQKSPPKLLILSKNHNPLTISLLPHQRYQKPLKAISKRERRQGESRAKVVGELAQPSMSRTMSVTSLNSKPLTTISSLYIIRNKNPKTLHFPHFLIFSFPHFLISSFSHLLISSFANFPHSVRV